VIWKCVLIRRKPTKDGELVLTGKITYILYIYIYQLFWFFETKYKLTDINYGSVDDSSDEEESDEDDSDEEDSGEEESDEASEESDSEELMSEYDSDDYSDEFLSSEG